MVKGTRIKCEFPLPNSDKQLSASDGIYVKKQLQNYRQAQTEKR